MKTFAYNSLIISVLGGGSAVRYLYVANALIDKIVKNTLSGNGLIGCFLYVCVYDF